MPGAEPLIPILADKMSMSTPTSESKQNLADTQDALASDGSHLRETLNRRSKTLSYMRPIYELEANKNRYPELGLDRYDIFRLISAVLDTIITSMGGLPSWRVV